MFPASVYWYMGSYNPGTLRPLRGVVFYVLRTLGFFVSEYPQAAFVMCMLLLVGSGDVQLAFLGGKAPRDPVCMIALL